MIRRNSTAAALIVSARHITVFLGDFLLLIVDKYLVRPAEIVDLLRRLSAAGKKLFLITNSTAEFVWVCCVWVFCSRSFFSTVLKWWELLIWGCCFWKAMAGPYLYRSILCFLITYWFFSLTVLLLLPPSPPVSILTQVLNVNFVDNFFISSVVFVKFIALSTVLLCSLLEICPCCAVGSVCLSGVHAGGLGWEKSHTSYRVITSDLVAASEVVWAYSSGRQSNRLFLVYIFVMHVQQDYVKHIVTFGYWRRRSDKRLCNLYIR